jgi:uncharacterized membrane protein
MKAEVLAEGPVTKVNIGRLTNTIFIFTLLLLFKNIRLPGAGDLLDMTPAHKFGAMQIPDILDFLMAFLIIAMIWIITFHTFHLTKKMDRTYIYIHLAMLMTLILIPASIHYTVVFPDRSIFPTVFHSIMLIIGLLLFLEWRYISRTSVVCRGGIFGWQKHCITIKLLLLPATACIGILLAMADLPSTQFIYFGTMAGLALVSAYSWRCLEKAGRDSA